MRCPNCNSKINNKSKFCPECGNKTSDNLPFKAKRKEWIDKHLLLVNIINSFPVNVLYSLLPAFLIFKLFSNFGFNIGMGDVKNTLLYLVGMCAIFPFSLGFFVVLYFKTFAKSFKMSKYSVNLTNNKKYYIFIILDIVGLLVMGLCLYLF